MLLFILIGVFALLSVGLGILARFAFHDQEVHSHDPIEPQAIYVAH